MISVPTTTCDMQIPHTYIIYLTCTHQIPHTHAHGPTALNSLRNYSKDQCRQHRECADARTWNTHCVHTPPDMAQTSFWTPSNFTHACLEHPPKFYPDLGSTVLLVRRTMAHWTCFPFPVGGTMTHLPHIPEFGKSPTIGYILVINEKIHLWQICFASKQFVIASQQRQPILQKRFKTFTNTGIAKTCALSKFQSKLQVTSYLYSSH